MREPLAIDIALGFGEPDRDHLLGVVPLVDRRRDVEALVALQPDQPPPERLASTLAISVLPTPASPSRNSGRPMRSARNSTVASERSAR